MEEKDEKAIPWREETIADDLKFVIEMSRQNQILISESCGPLFSMIIFSHLNPSGVCFLYDTFESAKMFPKKSYSAGANFVVGLFYSLYFLWVT